MNEIFRAIFVHIQYIQTIKKKNTSRFNPYLWTNKHLCNNADKTRTVTCFMYIIIEASVVVVVTLLIKIENSWSIQFLSNYI